MAKFWKVFKVIVFVWGALTLALIVYGLITTFVMPLFKGHSNQAAQAPAEEVMFEKKDGGLTLVVKRKETPEGPDAYLITLSRDNKPVVQNYRLPTQKYHLDFVRVYDASIVPGRENEIRLVLYSNSDEGEGNSDSQLWFLKVTDAMSVREVITLSDVHTSEDTRGMMVLGNKRFGIPFQEGFQSEPFVVPVMVRAGDSISISPLLSSAGADALHTALEQEIKARMAKLSKDKEEKHGEQYQKIRKEMDEALSEKVIAY
jgi:hypothetical protein